MWKFRTDAELTPTEVAQTMKTRLEALNGQIEGLIKMEVGINDIDSSNAFDAVLISEFESAEALEKYKKHPLPGRQAFISCGSKEPRSALESRRVSLGAQWVDSRESSLLRRLERGREIGL